MFLTSRAFPDDSFDIWVAAQLGRFIIPAMRLVGIDPSPSASFAVKDCAVRDLTLPAIEALRSFNWGRALQFNLLDSVNYSTAKGKWPHLRKFAASFSFKSSRNIPMDFMGTTQIGKLMDESGIARPSGGHFQQWKALRRNQS